MPAPLEYPNSNKLFDIHKYIFSVLAYKYHLSRVAINKRRRNAGVFFYDFMTSSDRYHLVIDPDRLF